MGLAMMLFCVVIVFFCCNILALVVNLLEVRERYLLCGHRLLLLQLPSASSQSARAKRDTGKAIIYFVLSLSSSAAVGQGYSVFCVVIVFFCCKILALVVNLLEVRER